MLRFLMRWLVTFLAFILIMSGVHTSALHLRALNHRVDKSIFVATVFSVNLLGCISSIRYVIQREAIK